MLYKVKILLCLIIFYFVVGCTTSKESLSDNSEHKYISPEYEKDADFCFVKGDYDCAIFLYSKLLETYPSDASLYLKRSTAFSEKGYYDSAIGDITKALEFNFDNQYLLYYARGQVYYQKSQFEIALEDLHKAILLNNKCSFCYNSLGKTYSHLLDSKKAIRNFKLALKYNPENTNYILNLAFEYQNHSYPDSAMYIYNQGLLTDSLNPYLLYNKGLLFYELNQKNKGNQDIRKSISIDKTLDQFLYRETHRYIRDNNLSVADELLEILNDQIPLNSEYLIQRAKLKEYLRDNKSALFYYSEAIKIDSTNTGLFYYRARIYMHEQNYSKAIEDFTEVLDKNPVNTEALIKRGFCWYKLNKTYLGKIDWENALKLGDTGAQKYLDTYTSK